MSSLNSKLLAVVRRDPRYAYEAYEFVFQALEFTQKMLGRATDERAVDIRQGDADTVDLQLGDVVDRASGNASLREPAAHAVVECAKFVLVVGVVETEHRLGVRNRLKTFCDASADSLSWRIGADEIRMIGFELLQLTQQLVELGVADLGLVRDVVALFVMTNLATELCDSGGDVHV